MPRANRYLLPGYACHLTHRCHDGEWLLRFQGTRAEYRKRLLANLAGSGVSLLAYSLTSNHVHLIISAEDPDAVPVFMQRQQGEFAEWYNRCKRRSGAFWNGRYHATMIQSGEYLWKCMRYVDLNMVRAGAAAHPLKWRGCGYDELIGQRRRYRLLDMAKVLELTECADVAELSRNYSAFVEEAIAGEQLQREAQWTESIAVGSREFVMDVAERIEGRVQLDVSQAGEDVWTVREPECAYGAGAVEGA